MSIVCCWPFLWSWRVEDLNRFEDAKFAYFCQGRNFRMQEPASFPQAWAMGQKWWHMWVTRRYGVTSSHCYQHGQIWHRREVDWFEDPNATDFAHIPVPLTPWHTVTPWTSPSKCRGQCFSALSCDRGVVRLWWCSALCNRNVSCQCQTQMPCCDSTICTAHSAVRQSGSQHKIWDFVC